MQFICTKHDLSKAIGIASRAISKVQQTILDSILFEANDDGVTLRATDRTISVRTRLAAEVREAGRAAIPARLLAEFVNHLPEADVNVNETTNRMVEISCLSAKGRLQLMDHEEFPALPEVPQEQSLTIPADQLVQMIQRTIFAAASSEDRPVLTGVLFDITPDRLRLVAVDGYRMAIREEAVGAKIEGSFLIPSRALREAARTIGEDAEDMTVSFDKGRVAFETASTQIIAQLLEGEFVPYQKFFPETFATHVQVDRLSLQQSVERALIIASQGGSQVVHLEMSDNVLTVAANAQTASSNESVPVIMRGQDLHIALNGRFILDVLRSIDDTDITMTFNTPVTPCAIEHRGMQAYHYLILPVQTHSS